MGGFILNLINNKTMLKIDITINNVDFEAAVAKKITLTNGGDLSKEITNMFLSQLKEMAGHGVERLAEDQVKSAIDAATDQKKQDFEILIASKKT